MTVRLRFLGKGRVVMMGAVLALSSLATPAIAAEHSYPSEFLAVGEEAFFLASDGVERSLWRTDGTEIGTVRVTTAEQGSFGTIARVGERLLLTRASELWVTDVDGDPLEMVAAFEGPLTGFVMHRGGAHFLAGPALWRSDGTTDGTVRVSPAGVTVSSLYVWGTASRTFFFGEDAEHGMELWTTEGAADDAAIARDIAPGPADGVTSPWASMAGPVIVFAADDRGGRGRELWRSDGTEAGTVRVKDIFAGPYSSSPSSFEAMTGGRAIFLARTPDKGVEPFVTDGTKAGTRMVTDLKPGAGSTSWRSRYRSGRWLYFSTKASVLYRTDGTAAGTQRIRAFDASSQGGVPECFGRTRLGLLFTADERPYGGEPWTTDGTAAATRMIRDIRPTGWSNPCQFTDAGSVVVFAADDGLNGRELWVTDGTRKRTRLLVDLNPPG